MSDEPEVNPRQLAVARALAELIKSVLIDAKRETRDEDHDARNAATTRWLESMEAEMQPISAQLVAMLGDTSELPEGLQSLARLSANPEHQFDIVAKWCLWILGFAGIAGTGARIGSQVWANQLWAQNPNVPMAPADAADLVVRNVWTAEKAAAAAAQSGLNQDNFDGLVAITGEPPGPIDMLSLWRRGLMSDDELEHTIRYSRIRDEFIPYVKLLAHSWMSPTDAIELAIKQIVTTDEARAYFVTAGGLDDQFDILYEAAGNSIGAGQAMMLWNHELIDETQVDQVLGRTRINPLFYPIAKLLRHKWFGPIQIGAAIKSGVITADQGQQWLVQDGYQPEQAAAFAQGEAATKVVKAKVDTEGMVIQQYVDHLFTATEAIAALAQLGYSATEADLIVSNADAKRALSQQTAAVSAVRHAFMTGRITSLAASGDLDKLNIPAAAREQWLSAWSIEKSVATKELTTAQVGDMLKKSILTEAEAEGRWIAQGYDADDAKLLGYYYTGTLPPK